jgi:hypothetical protein
MNYPFAQFVLVNSNHKIIKPKKLTKDQKINLKINHSLNSLTKFFKQEESYTLFNIKLISISSFLLVSYVFIRT